jgi:hypothetical protein
VFCCTTVRRPGNEFPESEFSKAWRKACGPPPVRPCGNRMLLHAEGLWVYKPSRIGRGMVSLYFERERAILIQNT